MWLRIHDQMSVNSAEFYSFMVKQNRYKKKGANDATWYLSGLHKRSQIETVLVNDLTEQEAKNMLSQITLALVSAKV